MRHELGRVAAGRRDQRVQPLRRLGLHPAQCTPRKLPAPGSRSRGAGGAGAAASSAGASGSGSASPWKARVRCQVVGSTARQPGGTGPRW